MGEHVGLGGHSAGGSFTARYAPKAAGLKAAIVMAYGSAPKSDKFETLLLEATEDALVGYSGTKNTFERDAVAPAKFLGISKAGHLAFSQICSIYNPESQNIYETALKYGICGSRFMKFLFDCDH